MSVSLKKGEGVNLKKDAPNLKRILVGLGWDPVLKRGEKAMDIDASVICINSKKKKEDVVYYGNRHYEGDPIYHHGDNLTGDGDGDDEQIEIKLDDIPANIERLAIIINIYEAKSRNQDFGRVENCFVHVTDMDTQKELVRYDIDDNFNGKTGIFVADIYRYNGEWKFKALGQGVEAKDIKQMVKIKCD